MPHYRKLWRKFTESEDVNEMPDDTTRLAWALLPLALDREGLGLDNAAWLRAQLFPLREDITTQQVRDMMDCWADRRMILRYAENGKRYFYCPTFHAYQGDCEREAKSEIPPPPPDLYVTNTRPILAKVVSGSGTQAPRQTLTSEQAQEQASIPASAPEDREVATAVVAADDDALTEYVAILLSAFGMNEPEVVAREAARYDYSTTEIRELIAHAEAHDLGPGWLRGELRAGRRAPPRHEVPHENPRRYIEGQFADCIQH